MRNIECIARAVIEENGKILLCRGKGNSNWFFPGGHIEEGESAPEALVREIQEELGEESEVKRFLGASENKFEQSGTEVHEINLVFEVALLGHGEYGSIEDHLEFRWFAYDELDSIILTPGRATHTFLKSRTSEKPLWESEGF